ncbi:MAG: glycine zipper 2TM domain-containing protein [Kiritimatiellia bacterium]|jgi:outer membrane lipoprotein SlyB
MRSKSFQTSSLFIAVVACLALVSGCMNQDYAGTTYSRDHARQGHTIYVATIQSIQNVTIEGTEGVLGGIGGAVLGGVIGHSIGGGSGKDIATAAGAIGGAVAGSAIEGAATKKAAIEITVVYENGSAEAIVQQPGTDVFSVGQVVRVVVNADGTKRVRP